MFSNGTLSCETPVPSKKRTCFLQGNGTLRIEKKKRGASQRTRRKKTVGKETLTESLFSPSEYRVCFDFTQDKCEKVSKWTIALKIVYLEYYTYEFEQWSFTNKKSKNNNK